MCFTLFKKRLASDKVWLHFLNFGEVAGVAQLVEHFLAKEDVARSSRVTRSTRLEVSIKVRKIWV